MDRQYVSGQEERPKIYLPPVLSDWLQQPTVVVCTVLIGLTAFYQSLHSTPFSHHRHPGELLWDFIVAITPAWLLYTIDDWLNPPMIPVPRSIRPRTYTAKSEVLRKILGMDKPGGGIIGSVASVGRKSLSTLSGSTLPKGDARQPAGLGNIDYSCFQNSILQSLAALTPLPDYLDSAIVTPEVQEYGGNEGSASALQQLIAQLKDQGNNGKTLWTPTKLKSLHTWEQQDAQEYYSKLLDEVEKEVAKASKMQSKLPGLESAFARDDTESQYSDDSGYQSISPSSKTSPEQHAAKNPLEGMTAQRVACVQCGYSDGLSLIPFNCLTLNLGVGTTQHDLYELLDSYTQLEPIEGVKCAKCTLLKAQRLLKGYVDHVTHSNPEQAQDSRARLEQIELALEDDDFDEKTLTEKCKITSQLRSSSTKTKQVVIAKPPRSLAIHMNRSVFDENTGTMWKNLAAVRFPRTLDLGPWCLGSASQSSLSGSRTLVDNEKEDIASDEELWVADPKSSMISGDIYPSKISGPIYELRAVITHQGRHENGHYVCYRRHEVVPPKTNGNTSLDEAGDISSNMETSQEGEADKEQDSDKWWRLSDESVWDVAEDAVLAQGGVFMLFYDCVDPHSVLSSRDMKDSGEIEDTTPLGKSQSAVDGTAPTAEAPDLVSEVRDNFVQSLLSRPNSASDSSKKITITSGLPTPPDSPQLAASTACNAPDFFVSSLLTRPNS